MENFIFCTVSKIEIASFPSIRQVDFPLFYSNIILNFKVLKVSRVILEADLVTFTAEILNEKVHFLCSERLKLRYSYNHHYY